MSKRTLKFQMMMSPEEAAVLDDWMFEHRHRSRAEAIRVLVSMGLEVSKRRAAALADLAQATEEEQL